MRSLLNIGFTDCVVCDDSILFDNIFSGDIVKCDLKRDIFEVIHRTEVCGRMQYGMIIEVEDRLILIPRNATTLLIYEMQTMEKTLIALEGSAYCNKPLFIDAIKYNNSLYLIPGRYPNIVKFNLEKMTLDYIPVDKTKEELYTSCNVLRKGDYIYILRKHALFELDTETNSLYEKRKYELWHPLSALMYNDIIVSVGFGPKVMLLKSNSMEVRWIDKYFGCDAPKEGYSNAISIDGKIYLFTINQPSIYLLSIENEVITKYMNYDWGVKREEIWNQFTKCDVLGVSVNEGTLCFYSSMRNCIIEISTDTKRVVYHDDVRWDYDNMKYYLDKKITNHIAIMEGEIDLDTFLRYVDA